MSAEYTSADIQIVSLRTTVSQQSCALMQELAEALGPAFDPFVENVLPILAKMA
jgi:CLIP-associating protein 1/2